LGLGKQRQLSGIDQPRQQPKRLHRYTTIERRLGLERQSVVYGEPVSRDSCTIQSTDTINNGSDSSTAECIDSGIIGDGWGWDGSQSCRLDQQVSTTGTASSTSPSDCVDTGVIGDGWGWNGSESCRTSDANHSQSNTVRYFPQTLYNGYLLTSSVQADANGAIQTSRYYQYDFANRKASVSTDFAGNSAHSTLYFDSEGKLTSRVGIPASNGSNWTNEYHYSSDGLLQYFENYRFNELHGTGSILVFTTYFQWDAQQRLSSRQVVQASGELTNTTTFSYSGNSLTANNTANPPRRSESIFNAEGLVTQTRMYSTDGQLIQSETISHDDNGNHISREVRSSQGELTWRQQYTFQATNRRIVNIERNGERLYPDNL